MQYSLVTTREGHFPAEEIKRGTEVLCHGKWVKAPAPVEGEVTTLSSPDFPTTSFASEYATDCVYYNHITNYNEMEEADIGLTARAYFVNEGKSEIHIKKDMENLAYWYPRLVRVCGFVSDIKPVRDCIQLRGMRLKDLKPLTSNQLSERNLEYYLEGLLRKSFHWHLGRFVIRENPSETDKIVMRLLNISHTLKGYRGNRVTLENSFELLSHIKDDYNKSKVSEEALDFFGRFHVEFDAYCERRVATEITKGKGIVFPGICPDINGMSPIPT